MKISRLVKLVKKSGRNVLKYTASDEKRTLWIGSNCGLYPLYDMPFLKTKEQILTLLDIPKSEFGCYDVDCISGEAAGEIHRSFDAAQNADNSVDPEKYVITKNDNTYKVFNTEDGYKFVNTKHLDIIDYYDDGGITLYYYYYKDRIVVKAGFLPVGVVMCCNPVDENMVKEFETIYNTILQALSDKQREEEAARIKANRQIGFDDLFEESDSYPDPEP